MDAAEHEASAALHQASTTTPHTQAARGSPTLDPGLRSAVPAPRQQRPTVSSPATPSDAGLMTPQGKSANWAKLTQVELRTLLQCFGLPTDGNKATLVSRLALHTGSGAVSDPSSDGGTPEQHTPVSRRKQTPVRDAEDRAPRAHRPQIVSFDIETTIPRYRGDGHQYVHSCQRLIS